MRDQLADALAVLPELSEQLVQEGGEIAVSDDLLVELRIRNAGWLAREWDGEAQRQFGEWAGRLLVERKAGLK